MKLTRFFFAVFLGLSLIGCASYITKEEFAPKMYSEHPVSILVLPPINNSTAADAKDYYTTTVAEPLSNSDYYVFPIEVVYDVLQQEGMYDTETMLDVPVEKFYEYFGADAVLYVSINKWNTEYFITSGSVTVQADCKLISTHTGDTIWFYNEEVSVNTSGSNGGAGGLVGFIAQVVTTAIQTAVQDYVPVARDVNKKIFKAIPLGKYSPRFNKDQGDKIKKKELKQDNK
jgi:hypothetical protein